jgi:hypothetical protein
VLCRLTKENTGVHSSYLFRRIGKGSHCKQTNRACATVRLREGNVTIRERSLTTALFLASDGNLWDTNFTDSADPMGSVFSISPKDGAVLQTFAFDGTNGNSPLAGVIQAADGTFVGTTELGGTISGGGKKFAAGTFGFWMPACLRPPRPLQHSHPKAARWVQLSRSAVTTLSAQPQSRLTASARRSRCSTANSSAQQCLRAPLRDRLR